MVKTIDATFDGNGISTGRADLALEPNTRVRITAEAADAFSRTGRRLSRIQLAL